ncbi:MAG: hypothetical protein IJ070_04310, partial [Firmicutes bacterium]|nr:hypothetical protein [Bacillota bacterium]
AKKSSPDKDGVRIAELNEDSYKYLLWDHKPLTDFWQIGSGKARRLQRALMFTMGDVAERSLIDEEWFYKTFGIDGEILVDHAWGIEPVTMSDVKSYKSDSQSMSNGQVLPRAYEYDETCLVMREMIDVLCRNMYEKNKVSSSFSWWVSYDYRSLEKVPGYNGPVSTDFYGRLHPGHSKGTISLVSATNSAASVTAQVMEQFEQKTDHRLLFRRLGICANDTHEYNGIYQLNMFTDYEDQARERRMQWAMQKVRHKYGNNAIIKGMDLLDGATTIDRNNQIGGHSK